MVNKKRRRCQPAASWMMVNLASEGEEPTYTTGRHWRMIDRWRAYRTMHGPRRKAWAAGVAATGSVLVHPAADGLPPAVTTIHLID